MSRRFVDVRPGEARALALSFAYFFALLSGYYVLRSLREEMGIAGGVDNLPWLFTATFVVTLGAVALYSAAVARLPRARLIPLVYRCFGAQLVGFYLAFRLGVDRAAVARVFFVWLSVFNLFVVSIFWSFMADVWTREQGKRLFGFISAAGSAGALAGPALTALIVKNIGPTNLILISVGLLEAATLCAGRLGRVVAPAQAPVGGGAFAGIKAAFAAPFMRGLGLQTLLHTATATWVYLAFARLVSASMKDPAARTQLFAQIDFVVSLLSLVFQALAGRVMAGFGLRVALSIIPALSLAGFAAMIAWPTMPVMIVYGVLRRSLHYGIDRPAREVLFTVVPREHKYKAKSFLDTVVYRGGDAASVWMVTGLMALGGAASMTSLVAIPLTLVMLGTNFWLAKRAEAEAAPTPATPDSS